MSEENKTLIYAELQSGIVGGYVTDYSQIKNAPNENVNVQAVDTSETIDDVETDPYIKYVVQLLTEEQKEQARLNIGIDSSSSGNTVDLSGYATKDYVTEKINKLEITQVIYIPNEFSMPEIPVEGVLYLIGEE